MNEPDPFEAWKAARRERPVPSGFAERVAATAAQTAAGEASPWMRLWEWRSLRVAAWLAASLVLALRVAVALAVFVTRQ